LLTIKYQTPALLEKQAAMSEIITCQSVGYRQQGVDILAGINWRIERGRHWALLGPNGSGKTTLLKIACGYLWPTSGRVLRLGQQLLDLSELRRSIGWISADLVGQIPPGDTGLQTVVTGRFAQIGLKQLACGGPAEADFDDAAAELARCGCRHLADKPFGIFSQGERQQVLIARSRLARPMLLVLDEPCAGMDPGVRERFLDWLQAHVVNETSTTTVMVTHHIEEIVPGIEQTLILSRGRIDSAGPTTQIVTREAIEAVYQTRLARIEHCGGRLWPIWGD
jgi:iron complex transport system ATP-binding protein